VVRTPAASGRIAEQLCAEDVFDAEIPVCGTVAPDFGWSAWQGRLDEYPFSSLLAVEAVQAVRRQSERAAQELGLALRRAVFVESRCISAWHEVLGSAAHSGLCPQPARPSELVSFAAWRRFRFLITRET
jgi:hypothetical protein